MSRQQRTLARATDSAAARARARCTITLSGGSGSPFCWTPGASGAQRRILMRRRWRTSLRTRRSEGSWGSPEGLLSTLGVDADEVCLGLRSSFPRPRPAQAARYQARHSRSSEDRRGRRSRTSGCSRERSESGTGCGSAPGSRTKSPRSSRPPSPPTRARIGPDPLRRKDYLLAVQRVSQ